MSEGVEFSIARRRSDYFRATLGYALRQPFFVAQLFGLPVFASILAFVILRERGSAIQLSGTVAALVLAAAVELWPILRSYRVGSAQPGAFEPIFYRFDASGVEMRSATGESRAGWVAFNRALELQDYFVLRSYPGALHIIPKRDIATTALSSLRRLLEAQLPGKCQLSVAEISS